MIDAVRGQAEEALSRGKLSLKQMRVLMKHYEDAMGSYTYLTD
jgi:hypothetical protein